MRMGPGKGVGRRGAHGSDLTESGYSGRFPQQAASRRRQMKIRPTMQERVEIWKKATISTM